MTVVRLPEKRKYRNRPGSEDGLHFDSQRELARYRELKILQNGGVIEKLEADKKKLRYALMVNGFLIAYYTPDFQYLTDGGPVTEDVKGVRTGLYKIKKKLMKAIYGIEISEVS